MSWATGKGPAFSPAAVSSGRGVGHGLACRLLQSGVLAGLLLCSGCAAPQDAWWGPDKVAHLAVSATLGAVVTQAALASGEDPSRVQAQALGVVLVVGAGKEAYDQSGSGWSWRDMAWNLLGGLLGSTLARALH